jgi:predicted signal transduction protein with EAL and GGDEF domain
MPRTFIRLGILRTAPDAFPSMRSRRPHASRARGRYETRAAGLGQARPPRELATKDAAIAALRRDLDELATRDPCTRLYQHGPFRRTAAAELERAAAAGRPVTLALVDVDGFRALNPAPRSRTPPTPPWPASRCACAA